MAQRYTVLDYTQMALSALESDAVNSITDTDEATMVANLVRRLFYDIADPGEFPLHDRLFQLTASGSSSLPVTMTKPADIIAVSWIKYNVETTDNTNMNFVELGYKDPASFLLLIHSLSEDDTAVDNYTYTAGSTSHTLMCRNNKAPEWWTSFDDSTILFDSFDNTVDTTLQSSKTQCFGRYSETFEMEDSYVPPLSLSQQQLLLNEVISTTFAEQKQTTNIKAEQKARKGWIAQQKIKREAPYRLAEVHKLPNYGR